MTDRHFRIAERLNKWYGFDVCEGHIFGTVDDVKYVSAAEPGPGHTLRVYFCKYDIEPGQNYLEWLPSYVPKDSPIGERIMEVKNANRGSKVVVKDVQIDSSFLKGSRRRVPHKVWKKH